MFQEIAKFETLVTKWAVTLNVLREYETAFLIWKEKYDLQDKCEVH
jgi:hypothetical protein